MGSSRDHWDEEVEDANDVVDAAARRGTPYTNPKGWSWDAASDAWIHDDGTVSGGHLIAPIAPRPPYPHGAVGAPVHGAIGAPDPNGDLSFTLNKMNTSSEIAVMTPHGKVKINLDTGALTIPHGIGREEAIRDFWLGFQENFRGAERAKYEDEIASLKKHISYITQKAEEYKNEILDTAKKSVVKKIAEKYGNEKFIMMKPADLIKFIEEA